MITIENHALNRQSVVLRFNKRSLPLRKLVEVVLQVFDIVSNVVDLNPEQINHSSHVDQMENQFHQKQATNFDIDTLEKEIFQSQHINIRNSSST